MIFAQFPHIPASVLCKLTAFRAKVSNGIYKFFQQIRFGIALQPGLWYAFATNHIKEVSS